MKQTQIIKEFDELSKMNSDKRQCLILIDNIIHSEKSEYNKLVEIEDLVTLILTPKGKSVFEEVVIK